MALLQIFLVHPEVSWWNFTEAHRKRLQEAIPQAEVRVAHTADEFAKALPEAETVVVWSFSQEWMDKAVKLKFIVTPAAGRDYFTVNPPAGVRIEYSSFHGRLIGETVCAMILAENRGIAEGIDLQAQGMPWPKHELSVGMRLLSGSTAIILGFGHIGREIGRLLKAFGVQIIGVKRTAGPSPDYFTASDRIVEVKRLHEVLPLADHLILALPGDTGTDNIIGKAELSLLKPHVALYNIGRGNALDERALVDALKEHRLRAAWLDVFREEPLKKESPLRSCPTCRIFPHSSAIAPQYLDFFLDEFIPKYRNWHGL